MQYLSPEEIRSQRDQVKERLIQYTGPTIRHGFGRAVFEKYAGQNKNIAVLDCGAASGGFLKDIAGAGFNNLYAVDIDDYLNLDTKKIVKEFKAADLSFDKLPWPDGFFDVLTGWCLIPHLENPHHFIREAYRTLKPGGLLIISLINVASPPNRGYFAAHGDFPAYHERNNHIAIITPAIFKKTILKYFTLVGTEYFITPRIFSGWRGSIRKILMAVAKKLGRQTALENRWGAKAVYILQKKT